MQNTNHTNRRKIFEDGKRTKEEQDMMSEMEKRIRECYDAFLETVTEEDRDLWEIALLEHDSAPL